MHKILRYFLIAILLSPVSYAEQAEQRVIRAAVAEGYVNGLQAKFIYYIVDKLDAELKLSTMPFARRVKAVRDGKLDLMVGIQRTDEYQDEFIYIEPYYESLSYRFFTLRQNQDKLAQYNDLKGSVIGVNRHAKYFTPFNDDEKIEKVDVQTVENKVNLLLHERIDAFIHYQETALPYIKSKNLSDEIALSHYQPEHISKYYVAISSHSWLMGMRSKIKTIIVNGIANGDFKKIRQQHYMDKYK